MKKIILLLTVVLFANRTKAQCTPSNSPTFQLTTSQETLATNGFCSTQISIVNANTNPIPSGALVFSFIAPNGSTYTPPPPLPPIAGTWTVVVTDVSNSCSTSETVQVNVFAAPSVSVATIQPTLATNDICATQVYVLGSAVSYTFIDPNGNPNPPPPFPPIAGIWTVTGSDVNACSTSQTVQVNVFAAPTISVTASNTLICLGYASTLTASGANTYTWSNGTMGNQLTTSAFTATGNATYSVQLQGTSNEGCVDNTTVSINLNVQDCNTSTVGIGEIKNENLEVKIYPNPANDNVSVELKNINKTLGIKITDLTGRELKTQTLTPQTKKIDISDLSNGVYFFSVYLNNQHLKTEKVIKQ